MVVVVLVVVVVMMTSKKTRSPNRGASSLQNENTILWCPRKVEDYLKVNWFIMLKSSPILKHYTMAKGLKSLSNLHFISMSTIVQNTLFLFKSLTSATLQNITFLNKPVGL